MRKTILICILLLFQAQAVLSQLYFYPKVGVHSSVTTISEDDYVSKAFTTKPPFFLTYGVGLSKRFSEKYTFQSEILFAPLSHNVMLTSNYFGNKKWQSNFNRNGFVTYQQLNFSWQLESKPVCFGWIGYAKIGASAFFKIREADYFDKSIIFNVDPVTGKRDSVIFDIHENGNRFLKPGVLLGFGLKRTVRDHNYFSFGLSYHQGFSTLNTTRVTYQVDGQTFDNRILNKGTALVFEAIYGINLQKKNQGLDQK